MIFFYYEHYLYPYCYLSEALLFEPPTSQTLPPPLSPEYVLPQHRFLVRDPHLVRVVPEAHVHDAPSHHPPLADDVGPVEGCGVGVDGVHELTLLKGGEGTETAHLGVGEGVHLGLGGGVGVLVGDLVGAGLGGVGYDLCVCVCVRVCVLICARVCLYHHTFP